VSGEISLGRARALGYRLREFTLVLDMLAETILCGGLTWDRVPAEEVDLEDGFGVRKLEPGKIGLLRGSRHANEELHRCGKNER
jgi:hypothetical protein